MLAEWHLTPEYLLENWTDEQFDAFWQARNSRIVETTRALKPKEPEQRTKNKRVSDTELFAYMKKTHLMPQEFDRWLN